MTAPAHRPRPAGGGTAFSLRRTTLWFVLAAIVLCGLWFAGRVVVEAAGRHPVAAVALCLLTAPAVAGLLRGRRRLRAARAARRAAEALDEGAEAALETLEEPAPERQPLRPLPGAAETAVPAAAEPAEFVDPVEPAEPTVELTGSVPAADHGAYYDALDAERFEQAVAALCERDGCRDVSVVGGAGDLGADVLATAPDGRRVVVQCKHYGETNKVGSQDVQRFGGTCWTVHEAEVAAVVTTSDFTAPAVEYAEQCGILCVGREALLAWSDGTGPAPWETAPPAGPGPAGE
ncbi:restriction endonuclease [Streptomyces sp. TRM 70361]|uniref:restriction endonuclease n=1 Tax=Streptomyces sp. TRM 70361 TaxID=3116553 RepID=UPI002E7BE698|nr:restriction endonuclease [Streptomyces sp. TRM 70361]MEE1940483.1 restriction endonuclease [Streptomyces sp. TRM 70361]